MRQTRKGICHRPGIQSVASRLLPHVLLASAVPETPQLPAYHGLSHLLQNQAKSHRMRNTRMTLSYTTSWFSSLTKEIARCYCFYNILLYHFFPFGEKR